MARLKVDKLKVITHAAALSPLLLLALDYRYGALTADPVREIQLRTGKDALVFLILALACTPARVYLGIAQVTRVRRTLGLYGFAYATLHFFNFVGLDYGFNVALIYDDIAQKPFALLGLATLLILTPLAVTSTNGWVRRLGKSWKRLHRLFYVAVPLASAHFFWARLYKLNIVEPLVYTGLVAILLTLRITSRRSES